MQKKIYKGHKNVNEWNFMMEFYPNFLNWLMMTYPDALHSFKH